MSQFLGGNCCCWGSFPDEDRCSLYQERLKVYIRRTLYKNTHSFELNRVENELLLQNASSY